MGSHETIPIEVSFAMLVDSHCHLDFPDFEAELDAIVARAHEAGVGAMMTICTHVRRFERIRAVAERFENVCCSVGTHPHYAAAERDVTLDEILKAAEYAKVTAIGEAGLDYHYEKSPIPDQEHGFRLHIAAARETGLPLVIHSREADEHTARILEEEMARGEFKAVLHCYTGGRELAMRGVELGLYVSFSGVLTFKKSEDLRAIAAEVPLDRLLVETDAPYLAPMPMRGKRNEPSFVRHTAKVLAETRGLSEAEIARATTDNFFRLFSKADGLVAIGARSAA
jgi:TatD DNase family protein